MGNFERRAEVAIRWNLLTGWPLGAQAGDINGEMGSAQEGWRNIFHFTMKNFPFKKKKKVTFSFIPATFDRVTDRKKISLLQWNESY